MQKFEVSDEALSLRRNIVVMADEAHRGQYGLTEKVKMVTNALGEKIAKILVDVAAMVFYWMVYRSGKLYAAKAMAIKISTMPKYRMGQVYKIFPAAAVLCIFAAVVHLVVTLTETPEDKEEVAV